MITFMEFLEEQEVKEVLILDIEEDDEEIFESILPSQAISSASKKDIKKMSRMDLNKILDKFSQLVDIEYSKSGTKKQKFLGRIRYLTSKGNIEEYPVKTRSLSSYEDNESGKIVIYDKINRKLRVEIGEDDWRNVPLDNVMALNFKGKVFSLEDHTRNDGIDKETQSSKISKFIDNQAKQSTIVKNKLFQLMKEFSFEDIPKNTTEELERKAILKNIKKPITDNMYKVVAKNEPKGSYDVKLVSYNPKTEIVRLNFKLNKRMILDYYGVDSLVKTKVEAGYTPKSWVERTQFIIADIKQKFINHGLTVLVGTDWVSGTV